MAQTNKQARINSEEALRDKPHKNVGTFKMEDAQGLDMTELDSLIRNAFNVDSIAGLNTDELIDLADLVGEYNKKYAGTHTKKQVTGDTDYTYNPELSDDSVLKTYYFLRHRAQQEEARDNNTDAQKLYSASEQLLRRELDKGKSLIEPGNVESLYEQENREWAARQQAKKEYADLLSQYEGLLASDDTRDSAQKFYDENIKANPAFADFITEDTALPDFRNQVSTTSHRKGDDRPDIMIPGTPENIRHTELINSLDNKKARFKKMQQDQAAEAWINKSGYSEGISGRKQAGENLRSLVNNDREAFEAGDSPLMGYLDGSVKSLQNYCIANGITSAPSTDKLKRKIADCAIREVYHRPDFIDFQEEWLPFFKEKQAGDKGPSKEQQHLVGTIHKYGKSADEVGLGTVNKIIQDILAKDKSEYTTFESELLNAYNSAKQIAEIQIDKAMSQQRRLMLGKEISNDKHEIASGQKVIDAHYKEKFGGRSDNPDWVWRDDPGVGNGSIGDENLLHQENEEANLQGKDSPNKLHVNTDDKDVIGLPRIGNTRYAIKLMDNGTKIGLFPTTYRESITDTRNLGKNEGDADPDTFAGLMQKYIPGKYPIGKGIPLNGKDPQKVAMQHFGNVDTKIANRMAQSPYHMVQDAIKAAPEDFAKIYNGLSIGDIVKDREYNAKTGPNQVRKLAKAAGMKLATDDNKLYLPGTFEAKGHNLIDIDEAGGFTRDERVKGWSSAIEGLNGKGIKKTTRTTTDENGNEKTETIVQDTRYNPQRLNWRSGYTGKETKNKYGKWREQTLSHNITSIDPTKKSTKKSTKTLEDHYLQDNVNRDDAGQTINVGHIAKQISKGPGGSTITKTTVEPKKNDFDLGSFID